MRNDQELIVKHRCPYCGRLFSTVSACRLHMAVCPEHKRDSVTMVEFTATYSPGDWTVYKQATVRLVTMPCANASDWTGKKRAWIGPGTLCGVVYTDGLKQEYEQQARDEISDLLRQRAQKVRAQKVSELSVCMHVLEDSCKKQK